MDTKIPVGQFLTTAVRICGGEQEPVNVITSGIKGALHLAYGATGKDPVTLVREAMCNGDVLGRYVTGGIALRLPSNIKNGERARYLCEAHIDINVVRPSARHKEAAKGAHAELRRIFDYSEAARMCGHIMRFTQHQPVSGSSHKKGVSFCGLYNGAIKLRVQAGNNRSCFEYLLIIPSQVSDRDRFVETVRKRIEDDARPAQRQYEIPKPHRESAEKLLQKIMDACTEAEPQTIEAAEPQVTKDAQAATETPDEDDSHDLTGTSVALDNDTVILFLLELNKHHDLEKVVPREDFIKVLMKELSIDNPQRSRTAAYIRHLRTRKPPIILRVVNDPKQHAFGYQLTRQAKKLLSDALSNQKGESDKVEENTKQQSALPHDKSLENATTKTASSETKIDFRVVAKEHLALQSTLKKLQTEVQTVEENRDQMIAAITEQFNAEIAQTQGEAQKKISGLNAKIDQVQESLNALKKQITDAVDPDMLKFLAEILQN